MPVKYVIVDGVPTTFKEISDRLGIKPNSANARIKRRQKITGRTEFTWDELKRHGHGFSYKGKLPEKFICRNYIRKLMCDKGYSYVQLAKAMRTSDTFVARVLGKNADEYALTPEFVWRVGVALKLNKDELHELQELGARENGWDF